MITVQTSPSASAAPSTRPATERSLASRAEAAHDATLVRRFNAGDESAFLEIMERYRDKIFAITFALLRNRSDAEERPVAERGNDAADHHDAVGVGDGGQKVADDEQHHECAEHHLGG